MKKLFLFLTWLMALPVAVLAQGGDSWETATLLTSGTAANGTLGEGKTDAWYKFEIPSDGILDLEVTPDQSGDVLAIHYTNLFDTYEKEEGYKTARAQCRAGNGYDPASLTLKDIGPGTYYLNVHRWGGEGGYTIKYVFTPNSYTNDKEPNEAYDQSILLENGKELQGHLGFKDATSNTTDTDDWYKFEIPSDGTLDLEVTPDQSGDVLAIHYTNLFDTYEKEEGFKTARAQCRAGNGYDPASLTLKDIGPGTYYLNVHRWGGEGGYAIKYVFTPNTYANDKEPNETYDQSIALEEGKELQGHLGFKDAKSNTTDIDDWYRIEIPKDGTFTLDVTPDQDTRELAIHYTDIYSLKQCEDGLKASRSQCRAGNGYDPASLTVKDMGKGTYYLQVHRWGGEGGYTIKYVFTPNPYANDEEYNNSYEQARPIQNGETVKGHLGFIDADSNTADTDDWYKIEIPKDGTFTLDVTPDQSEKVLAIHYTNIYSAQQCEDGLKASRSQCRAYNGYDPASLTIEDLGKGTYYLQVHRWGGEGGYTLKYEFEPYRIVDEEPNNDSDHAIEIKNGETKEGFLGIVYADGTTDADDWYMTTVAEGSQLTFSYVPDGRESLDVELALFYLENGELKNIVSRWPHWQSAVIETAENMKGGTYYFQIHRRGGVGAYSLTFGTPHRAEGSQIRVNYIGRSSVRLGIPSPFQIKVENISNESSGSFYIGIPCTPDIELLYAELPCDTGIVKVMHDEFADYDPEEGDCGVFVMPDLGPHQSYTFTMYAQGKVDGNSRSQVMGEKKALPLAIPFVLAGGLKYAVKQGFKNATTKAVAKSFVKDGITNGVIYFLNTQIMDDQKMEQYASVVGGTPATLRAQYSNPFATPVKQYASVVVDKILDAVPGGEAIKTVITAGNIAGGLIKSIRQRLWYWIYKDLGYIRDEPEVLDAHVGANGIVKSWDPNEMCGPVGVGDENYIGETQSVNYRILFENKKEATAPAYRIRISDELDPNVFDITSVRFGSTSHEGVGYNWKMTREGNKLFWDIEGIELPPNVNAPEGEGYVTFSVDLKPGLGNLTQIKNKATIIFDYNEPIETNEYVNTLDLNEPVATMTSATEKGRIITVKCKAADAESGVRSYMFFVSVNDEPFEYIGDSTEPVYELEMGEEAVASDFKFYALAVDNVGNTQQTPPAAISVGGATLGDANGDGTVNAADIVEVVNYIMGSPSSKFDAEKADVNGDGTVNAADIVAIVNIIMGV